MVALKPELNDQNQLELEMKVAADNRAGAVDLVHRMEGSKHFQGAQLVQEQSGRTAERGIAATIVGRFTFPTPPNRSGK